MALYSETNEDEANRGSYYSGIEGYAPNLKSFTSVKAATEIKMFDNDQILDKYLESFADVGIKDVVIAEAVQGG